jgi:hypothetical protein
MKPLMMRGLLFCGVLLFSCAHPGMPVATASGQTAPEEQARDAVMLVLGSSRPETRAARVSLACGLIKSKPIPFKRIILSGGCGAHGTEGSNCEATDMERLLKAACAEDIAGIAVYKEEESLSTVQNYCYSRRLKQDGEALIRRGDVLYVVSTHHHALSVAACFRNEGVDARYHYSCGGSLYDGAAPSPGTVAASADACYQDYAGIAQNCGRPNWCESLPPPR